MRSTEERIKAVKIKTDELKRRQTKRQTLIFPAISMVACIILIVGISIALPALNGKLSYNSPMASGSILQNNEALLYIIIGILSFILGLSFTILCVLLRNKAKGKAFHDGNN